MSDEGKIIYDPMTQMSEMNMRVVGTKSLKVHPTKPTTKYGGWGNDKKNEIDDQKNVK